MTSLNMWRLCATPIRRVAARSLTIPVNDIKIQQPHVYKKTYKEDELIKYFVNNVVYESGDYIVTSTPQGVKFLNENRWMDCTGPPVCETSLQDMIPNLCKTFNLKCIFVTKHPRRNASGLLLFSKSFRAFRYLRSNFERAVADSARIYTYLAVVLGHPQQSLLKTFTIEQGGDDTVLNTVILEKGVPDGIKSRKTKYAHTVIDSTENFSLLRISVSYDLRDCVRHILSQKCCTPVFGDSWSITNATKYLFGAPLKTSATMKPEPFKLGSDVLEKLHLSEGEEKFIPIHLHLYGLKLSLKNHREFFVSVPPAESFLWTCNQLGLHKIQELALCPTNTASQT